MDTEQSFMKAILEAPEDDGIRLVFADWLEERGDPRAEFIRVQFAEEERPDYDTIQQLLTRDLQLVAAHGDEWAKPFVGLADHWHFRRGFVESVTLPARTFIERGGELFTAAPVRH